MLRDIRFGLRMLRKQPSFAVIAVVTLALGVGATAAVFSLIQGVLLTPPPYQKPQQLVLIQPARTDGQKVGASRGWPAQQWSDWQKQSRSLQSVAAYSWTFNFLIRDDGSESMEGMAVTGDYFRAAGLQPLMGRTFLASETAFPTAPVIILGYDLWQRAFNGDPNIVGKTVRMSRRQTPPTVVGVMPPGVRFLPSPGVAAEPNYNVNAAVDFWVPDAPNPEGLKDPYWDVVARMKDGVSPQQVREELTVLTSQEAAAEHDFAGIAPRVQLLSVEMNGEGGRILYPLLGAAGLVLLIACGNAAALLLVRGLQRQQEYAVRSALGVGRMGLFRQVSTESLLLALLGGGLGAGLAFGLVKVFQLIGGHAVPRLDAVKMGWPVLAWGMGSAVIAALLAGVVPALRASRMDPMSILKGGGGPNSSAGRGERSLMRGVTVAQTALTLALLVGAGLLIRTMHNIAKVPSGYNTSRVLTMSVTAVQGNLDDFHHRALERVSALGGVEAAGFAWGVPLTGNNWQASVDVEGQPAPAKASDLLKLPLRSVTPGYFDLLRLRVLEGRDFRQADDRKAPGVALVNQAFADRYFHGSPVGKKLWFDGRDKPANEIIGLVANSRTDDLTQAPEPEVYLCFWQNGAFSKHLVIRATGDPRTLTAAIQHELRAVDSTVAVENSKTLEQIRDESLASRRFAMDLLIGFSIAGSVLTLVGIYGVLSLSVASRKRELAIRSAVGAQPGDIVRLVFGEGFRLVAAGVVAGLFAALALAGVLRSFLFGLEPTDPLTLGSVGLLFAAVALLACWVPTRRATKIDPLDALRYE